MDGGQSYEILQTIGRGGFGDVYLAEARGPAGFAKKVALKVLNAEFADDPEVLRRLRDEARILGLVRHRAIVRVDALLELDGRWTVVMEYVDGVDLRDLARAVGTVPADPATEICGEIAGALHVAFHTKDRSGEPLRLIHRDIKPANVRLTPFGEVKLLDFGIARAEFEARETRTTRDSWGSVAYMAPERFDGVDGPAGDIYALGATLLELITGSRIGRSSPRRERHEEVTGAALKRLAEVADAPLCDLLTDMLAWDPAARPTAREVQRRCARLSDTPDALREWAERVVPGAAAAPSVEGGELTGHVDGDATRGWVPEEDEPPAGNTARTNIPTAPDAFFGREHDLLALADALGHGSVVTITGPAGTGKTRLAQEYGRAHVSAWPGGVWQCDLATTREVRGLCYEVAGPLEINLGANPVDQLADAIAGRGRTLLVLDNFEHLVDFAPETIGVWARRAPEAAFLITSREVLQLFGERVVPLEPLPLPDGDAASNPAVALFADRARANRPDFELDAGNTADVVQLVELLDGLPLAIELAAARARVLSPRQLVQRMSRRFDLLRGGRRDLSDRQSTLRAAIDWSWDHLDPWEKSALAQASVFRGGFTLEAAEEVLDIEAWPDAGWAMDVVQALVDKSLLRTWAPKHAPDDPRFGMYGSIRDYADERLGTEDADASTGPEAEEAAKARHGQWYARLGEPAAIESLSTHGGVARRRALVLDIENLVAACMRAVHRGDAQTAARCSLAGAAVLGLRGPLAAAADLLEAARALPLSDADRVRVTARLADVQDDMAKGERPLALIEQALAEAEGLGDPKLHADVLYQFAKQLRARGRMEEAAEYNQEALVLYRQSGSRLGEGNVMGALALLRDRVGDPEQARRRYEVAISIQREVGNRLLEGNTVSNLGELYRIEGDLEMALRLYEEGLDIHREVGNRRSESIVLVNLGILHKEAGRLEQAGERLREALDAARALGDLPIQAVVLGEVAEVQSRLGNEDAAWAAIREAEDILRESNQRVWLAVHLCTKGRIAATNGRLDEARAAFDEATTISDEMGVMGTAELAKELAELARVMAEAAAKAKAEA